MVKRKLLWGKRCGRGSCGRFGGIAPVAERGRRVPPKARRGCVVAEDNDVVLAGSVTHQVAAEPTCAHVNLMAVAHARHSLGGFSCCIEGLKLPV